MFSPLELLLQDPYNFLYFYLLFQFKVKFREDIRFFFFLETDQKKKTNYSLRSRLFVEKLWRHY